MSSFYSPFTDKSGNFIDISRLQHRHLMQLISKEIQEGYQVEYKSSMSDSVKKKIPKIITSFANSAGGWLFVGVDEKTNELDKLEKSSRTDYSQIISQLLREHVSPLPRFDARFLKSKNSSFGVLAVYIFEGNNPPYVADGTIYVRNGSSSEPVKSQRTEIDILYQKAKDFDSKIKDFCKRDLYYPMDDRDSSQVVLCNVYIMNTNKLLHQKTPITLDELAEKFINISPNQFHNYIFSNDSIVFRNSKEIGQFQIGINFELFSDYSIKMHMPIKRLEDDERDNAIDRLRRISGHHAVDDFLLLDGYSACQSFQYIVQQYFQFLQTENVDLFAFLYQLSLEESEDSILYFDSEPYAKYVRMHDIPYCCKNALQIAPHYFRKSTKSDNGYNFFALLIHFFFMFGLNPRDAAHMYTEAMKADPTRNLVIR